MSRFGGAAGCGLFGVTAAFGFFGGAAFFTLIFFAAGLLAVLPLVWVGSLGLSALSFCMMSA
jgi:hypothetical protein